MTESLLSLSQFSTTAEFDAVERHDAVDDEEAVLVGFELALEVADEFELLLKRGVSFVQRSVDKGICTSVL